MASLTISVVVGLAVGIGLIVLFSILAKPAFTQSDDEIREKVRNLPEVQAYYERYTPLEHIWREGTSTHATYELNRVMSDVGDQYHTLRLIVKVDAFGKTNTAAICGGSVNLHVTENVLEFIKTTDCIPLEGLVYASES